MRRTSANLLQLFSTFGVTLAVRFYLCAGVVLTVAISCKIGNAKVNADGVLNLFCGWLNHFANSQQKEVAFLAHKVGLALTRFEQLFLAFTTDVRIEFRLRYQFHDFSIERIFHYGNFLVERKERET